MILRQHSLVRKRLFLKGYSGVFLIVPDSPEKFLTVSTDIAEIVTQILGQNNFFREDIEFTISVLTVFIKMKMSSGNE